MSLLLPGYLLYCLSSSPLFCTPALQDAIKMYLFCIRILCGVLSPDCNLCTQVSQWYELVVFTASMEIYGSAVADKLDNNRNILKRRYYRQVRFTLYLWVKVETDWAFEDFSFFLFVTFVICFLYQHCTLDLGSYIKDLSVVHDDLSSIVILDNSPGAYRSHPGKTTLTHSLVYTRCQVTF